MNLSTQLLEHFLGPVYMRNIIPRSRLLDAIWRHRINVTENIIDTLTMHKDRPNTSDAMRQYIMPYDALHVSQYPWSDLKHSLFFHRTTLVWSMDTALGLVSLIHPIRARSASHQRTDRHSSVVFIYFVTRLFSFRLLYIWWICISSP